MNIITKIYRTNEKFVKNNFLISQEVTADSASKEFVITLMEQYGLSHTN